MVIRDERVERELRRRTDEARGDESTPPLHRLASPLRRFAAFVVDYFIIAWPFIILTTSPFVLQVKEALLVDDEFSVQVSGSLVALVGLLTLITYQGVFHWLAGATPGKLVFGLRVAPLWSNRSRPTFWVSMGRATVWVLQFALLGLPFIAVMADPNRRPWHDRFGNTVVYSQRRRYAALSPNIYEVALTRTLTWIFVGIFLVAGFTLGLHEMRNARRTYEFSRQMNESGGGADCEAIDDALEDWPTEHGEAPQRLSVAMALFAAGDLNKDCLRVEVETPLNIVENRTLTFLAKSFVYSDNQELSDKYLAEVCTTDSKSDECRLARVIEGMADEDLNTIDQQFSGLDKEASVYLSIWALRQYLRLQDFSRAAEFLTRIPDHHSLASYVVPSRAKVLWGLRRSEESRAASEAAFDLLSGWDKLQFASWLCFMELAESCEARAIKSCEVFARLSGQIDDGLTEFQPALTHVKITQCGWDKDSASANFMSLNPEVREFAAVLASEDVGAMNEFWSSEESRVELKDEIAVKILSMSNKRSVVDPIRNEWLKRSRGLSWERLGREIFSREMSGKNWRAAAEVGERLMSFLEDNSVSLNGAASHRGFLEKYLISLYRAGDKNKARAMLKQMQGEERRPASGDEFAEVRRLLMEGK